MCSHKEPDFYKCFELQILTLKGTTDAPVKGTACFGALEKNGSADIHQQVSCLLMVFCVLVVCDVTAFPWCA